MSYIVLDLETRESFRDVGSWDPGKLTISLVGVIDARDGSERTYRLEELPALARVLAERPTVIGFNLLGFDYAVLKSAFAQPSPRLPPSPSGLRRASRTADKASADLRLSFDPYTLPTVDLFDHLQRQLGFRPKLDDLAAATLGRRKSGDGLQAIRLYQQGNWEALSRYCLDDVRLTQALYEHGLRHGSVKFPMRDGTIADLKATWVPEPVQAKMF